jgi:carbamoyltransferase
MKILGLSAYFHDSAACLVVDGDIVAAAQEERFTRKKHDPAFPSRAAAYCLSERGLRAAELDAVAFYEKPWLKFARLGATYLTHAPRGASSFLRSMPLWLGKKLWTGRHVTRELGYPGRVLYTEHHEAHASSAFFPSPYERAAILTVDGVGEWATASIGVGEGNRIRILRELRFPHSLGLLYSAFTAFAGFKVDSGEYKLMGLAPYGEPRYAAVIEEKLVEVRDDGSFRLNLEYFDFALGLRMTNARFEALFGGPARVPEGPLTERELDLAASIQLVTEKILLRMARHAHSLTGAKNLVLAGGVALNCVANGKILREGPFERLWIQPASGDAGGALGAALFVHHQLSGGSRVVDGRRDRQRGSKLGPAFSAEAIARFVGERDITAERHDDPERLAGRVAELLSREDVVGWFQGRMEFGPRALGSRSILGDARSARMQTTINVKIKFRESFRPFAPSVLSEHAPEYFDLAQESPYMLLVAKVSEAHRLRVDETGVRGLEKRRLVRSDVPAVTHVDASARIQTVARDDDPLYHLLLRAFYERTGCPVIVNTSFNVRGEPIVCTPEDAYRCFVRTHMDALVLGPFVIQRSLQRNLPPVDDSWKKEFELD